MAPITVLDKRRSLFEELEAPSQLDEGGLAFSFPVSPTDIAREFLIAATISRLGLDISRKRICADIPLLTELTLRQLRELGYVKDEAAVFAPPEQSNCIQQLCLPDDRSSTRLLHLAEGRTPWGVSIAALDQISKEHLVSAVEDARNFLGQRIEAMADQVQPLNEVLRPKSFDWALVNSTRDFQKALSFMDVDRHYALGLINKLCGIAPA